MELLSLGHIQYFMQYADLPTVYRYVKVYLQKNLYKSSPRPHISHTQLSPVSPILHLPINLQIYNMFSPILLIHTLTSMYIDVCTPCSRFVCGTREKFVETKTLGYKLGNPFPSFFFHSRVRSDICHRTS